MSPIHQITVNCILTSGQPNEPFQPAFVEKFSYKVSYGVPRIQPTRERNFHTHTNQLENDRTQLKEKFNVRNS